MLHQGRGPGFQIIWRYFSWSNQTLAMIALWVATSYLLRRGKYKFGSVITAIPTSFMSKSYALTQEMSNNPSILTNIEGNLSL